MKSVKLARNAEIDIDAGGAAARRTPPPMHGLQVLAECLRNLRRSPDLRAFVGPALISLKLGFSARHRDYHIR